MSIGFGSFTKTPVIQKMPVNEFDRATIVSCLPKQILEKKITLTPGVWFIDAADWQKEDISLLVVGPSSWFKEMEEGQPYLEIPTSSVAIADSIIKDYCNGLLYCNMGDTMPGMFFIPGGPTEKELEQNKEKALLNHKLMIKTIHADKIRDARAKQKRWMEETIKMADVLWARTQGNPLAISNDARLFAELLGFKNKAWMGDFVAMQLNNCPSCGEMVNFSFPVCKHCKAIINEERAKELGLKFVTV